MDEIVAYPSDPIAPADMAWYATSDNYDYADDTGASHPIGFGPTKADAIDDYIALTRD